jgi:hypothetical protein
MNKYKISSLIITALILNNCSISKYNSNSENQLPEFGSKPYIMKVISNNLSKRLDLNITDINDTNSSDGNTISLKKSNDFIQIVIKEKLFDDKSSIPLKKITYITDAVKKTVEVFPTAVIQITAHNKEDSIISDDRALSIASDMYSGNLTNEVFAIGCHLPENSKEDQKTEILIYPNINFMKNSCD